MVKCLPTVGHIVPSMRIDIVSFEVVSIDEAILFLMHVLIAVVLKALPVEVFAKSSVRQIPRLVFQVFVQVL